MSMNITGLFSYGILTMQHSLVYAQIFAGWPPVVFSGYIAMQKDPGHSRSCSGVFHDSVNYFSS